MAKKTIDFKDPLWMTGWLDTALTKEKEKYAQCPIKPDAFPGHNEAQAWGYVVAGYFLVEESFKALLHLRGKTVRPKHSLTMLFDLLDDPNDQNLLREYYSDHRETLGWPRKFPFETLDAFLANLDGDPNHSGNDYIGSFDWRYYLIEKSRGAKLPMVGVEFLHEIAYGCIRMAKHAHSGNDEPSRYTHSWRLRERRNRKCTDWLEVRMNSDGWEKLSDRVEILWGPDYKGRHDLLLFKGKGVRPYFSELPNDFPLPTIDKRDEYASFDVDEGLRSIGVTRLRRPWDD